MPARTFTQKTQEKRERRGRLRQDAQERAAAEVAKKAKGKAVAGDPWQALLSEAGIRPHASASAWRSRRFVDGLLAGRWPVPVGDRLPTGKDVRDLLRHPNVALSPAEFALTLRTAPDVVEEFLDSDEPWAMSTAVVWPELPEHEQWARLFTALRLAAAAPVVQPPAPEKAPPAPEAHLLLGDTLRPMLEGLRRDLGLPFDADIRDVAVLRCIASGWVQTPLLSSFHPDQAREARERAGVAVTTVARALSVPAPVVESWEEGTTEPVPSTVDVQAVLRVYGSCLAQRETADAG